MRATLRLYAAVKPGRYLEAGTPTGLTGLLTHPSPRSHLLSVYGSTLEQLKTFPESSVYRQSTEAVTKQRRNIIEQIKPAGYEEWEKRAQETIEKHAGLFAQDGSGKIAGQVGEDLYVAVEEKDGNDDVEWDGETGTAPWEGMKGEREARVNAAQTQRQDPFRESSVEWEPEPALETTQINEAESQIGAGLIEEVIEVAEGELRLVEIMRENKVWEELEEKPPAGQWQYFSRDTQTPGTQEVPNK